MANLEAWAQGTSSVIIIKIANSYQALLTVLSIYHALFLHNPMKYYSYFIEEGIETLFFYLLFFN